MAKKKLYRVTKGKKLAGVCGGIAEYFNASPTAIRLLWILLTLFVGFGILGYIIAIFVIPKKS